MRILLIRQDVILAMVNSPLSSIVNVSQSQRDLDKFIIGNAECELLKVLQEMFKSADVSDILSRDLVAMIPKDIK